LLSYEGSGTSSEFDEIVDSIDINNDGKIDFDEFVEHINQAVARVKTKSGS
jgi:Ca2+-binding EF-hand superfamily protein